MSFYKPLKRSKACNEWQADVSLEKGITVKTSTLTFTTLLALAGLTTFAFQNCAPPSGQVGGVDNTSQSAGGGGSNKGVRVSPVGSCGTAIVPQGTFYDFSTTPIATPNNASGGYDTNLSAAASAQYVRGSDGNDSIGLSMYDDAAMGGLGNDTISAAAGNDIIQGNQGNDFLYGGNGNDTIYGGQGDDTIYGDRGNDIIFGDLGNNNLYGANQTYSGTAEDGDDTFVLTVAAPGATSISNHTIYDVGGANRLVCNPTAGTTLPQGTATFSGNDLLIDFQGRGSVRIIDYKNHPFACMECGSLITQ
jgi:Ca2+-binding RTX toxin-like protein